jgi:uncharacterized membrane protein YhaH (DUF805 family)
MGRLKPYFTIKGRATRLEFWRFQQLQALALAAIMILTVPTTLAAGWLGVVPFSLIVPLLVATACVAIRRLHDRGRSAWWLAMFMAGPFTLAAVATPWARSEKTILIALVLSLAALVVAIWGWIEIGFRRGTRGENRFGPPPA